MSETITEKGSKRRKTRGLVKERRNKMIEMYSYGMTKSKIFDEISDQYHMSRGSVQNDWQKRGKWMPELMDEGSSGEKLNKLLTRYFGDLETKRAHLMVTYMKADNSSAEIHALRCLTRSFMKEVALRKSLGMLPYIPQKNEKTRAPLVREANRL